MKKLPDARGHFGRFGGRYVPETLMAPPPDLEAQVRALRLVTTKPVCVGSAIVRLVEERAGSPSLVTDVVDFIASLKEPLRNIGAKSKSR